MGARFLLMYQRRMLRFLSEIYYVPHLFIRHIDVQIQPVEFPGLFYDVRLVLVGIETFHPSCQRLCAATTLARKLLSTTQPQPDEL